MNDRIVPALIVAMLLIGLFPQVSVGQEETGSAMDFGKYHSYSEIRDELVRIATEYDDIASFHVLGQTWEGRDIMALRLTDNPSNEESEPDVLIMGAHHANELPSAEVPLYILEFLVGNYSSNSTVRRLLDTRDIWFVPLLNPDGREYAMGGDYNWRKNRRPIDLNGDGVPEGYGVDLNRNYGHLWGELPGTSHDLTDIDYCGPAPFSEAETGAIRNLANEQDFDVSLSYHSHGQVIFYPWNNNIDSTSPRGDVLEAIASEMGERNGYTPVKGVDAYPTTGDSDDWLYANASSLPFTIELGTAHQPPPWQILELCENNLAAALYAIDVAAEPVASLLPDWTFMTYMSGDNSLANEARSDINEMEIIGSTDDVNIINLYDGQTIGDSKLYRILNDATGYNSQIISDVLDDQGAIISPVTKELDMANPATLRAFVNWTVQNYPAQHYVLDLWGHGNGVLSGFCPDGSGTMRVHEINDALAGFELDIVGFDTCSMGSFEVARELVGIADIYIGSEALEPIAGWNYEDSLSSLVTSPNMMPEELARNIVSDYLAKYPTKDYVTMAALDMLVFREDFLPRLNDFVNVSIDFAYQDFERVWNARNASDTFEAAEQVTQETVDLYEFLGHLNERNIAEPVRKRINRLKEIENDLVIHSGYGSSHTFTDSMSIYFPALGFPILHAYDDLLFSMELWDEYLTVLKAPTPAPVITPLEFPELDSSTGPYLISAEMGAQDQANLTLFYRFNGGSWMSIPMSGSAGTFSCTIDGKSNGTIIDLYFQTTTDIWHITEPYEVKWGEADYHRMTVFTKCDIVVSDLKIEPASNIENGTVTNFTISCNNTGNETAAANVSVALSNANATILIGWEEMVLEPGTPRDLIISWVAVPGTWNVSVTATVHGVFDTNTNNQNMTGTLNVNASGVVPTPPVNKNFLDGLGGVLLLLVLLSLIPVIIFVFVLRGMKRQKRENALRLLRLTRQFIRTADDFDADTSYPNILLAKAEVAIAKGQFNEAERLSGRARECAMIAVGKQEK